MSSNNVRRMRTQQEVAAMFGVSLSTVKRRIADGTIGTVRLGRVVRIPDEEVARLSTR